MIRRGIFLFFIILGVSSCTKSKNGSQTTDLFRTTNPRDINKQMNKYQMEYSIAYLSIEKQDKEIDKIFYDFGNLLDTYGLVFKVKSKKKSSNIDYFIKIQNQLKSNFEYYNSPFLIFFKKNKNNFTPYKILSFHNIPKECLRKSLYKIDLRIRNRTIEKELSNTFFTHKNPSCQINKTLKDEKDYNLSTLYDLLKILLDTMKSQ